jgi:hypothetical protein
VTVSLLIRSPRLGAHLIGALLIGVSLGACAQSGFVDDGGTDELPAADEGNFAKSMLISMGAIDDPHPTSAPHFQPRAPLVVPPQRNLPAPVDRDAALATKGFPVDPEARSEAERKARLKGGNGQGDGAQPLTLAEQEKYKDLPTAPAVGTYKSDRDNDRALKPWELDGKAQAAALEATQNAAPSSPAFKERALLTPPSDYRTPSDKAPLESPKEGIAAMKPSWWPF